MKLTKKMCRMLGVYNPYEYAKGKIYIDYCPSETGRAVRYARWAVVLEGHNFGGHWRDYGTKTFTVTSPRDNKVSVLEDAKSFVLSFSGLSPATEFLKTPFGSYMVAEHVEQRNAELIALWKEKYANSPV